MDVATEVLRRQLAFAFMMDDVGEARTYLDSFMIDPRVPGVEVSQFARDNLRGSWFTPKNLQPDATLLYFHGGGYSFYPKAYAHLIALLALAAKSKTFALDYRLAPEHRFPAQLEDALDAYRWLLKTGIKPKSVVVGGDSAGGNLTLAFLLAARDATLPPPALAFLLSPATGFQNEHSILLGDPSCDWIEPRMVERWANWFCEPSQHSNPLVSPLLADLRGLPPIYIQAGRDETLFPSIQTFADRAKDQGADVVFESWQHMNHVFQVFGSDVRQSAEALRRLGDVIDSRVRGAYEAASLAKVI